MTNDQHTCCRMILTGCAELFSDKNSGDAV
jgi:hypothetical protein